MIFRIAIFTACCVVTFSCGAWFAVLFLHIPEKLRRFYRIGFDDCLKIQGHAHGGLRYRRACSRQKVGAR